MLDETCCTVAEKKKKVEESSFTYKKKKGQPVGHLRLAVSDQAILVGDFPYVWHHARWVGNIPRCSLVFVIQNFLFSTSLQQEIHHILSSIPHKSAENSCWPQWQSAAIQNKSIVEAQLVYLSNHLRKWPLSDYHYILQWTRHIQISIAMAVTPLVDGKDRSIDARSIVTLIVFFVVSKSISNLQLLWSTA